VGTQGRTWVVATDQKRLLNRMYQATALDFGCRFATAVFEGAIPKIGVPDEDIA